uniref:NADH dehydrogenase subunit 6 n=1 Tax=Cicadellidae sp. EMHAU-2015-Zz052706 TaxID=2037760 RepID=A0A2U7NV21_9HEMI|nr:NADH dehydrogenase subunit 6 [Cicadellidae sp. EMHAU-2015-Zz052706]
MKLIIMKLLMYISTIIFVLKTPMSMGMFLLLQTLLCTMLISSMSASSWIPMIVFLMLIGGLLILFMYMSSIASNEKFSPNIFILLLLVIFIWPYENFLAEEMTQDKLTSIFISESISLTKFYNSKTSLITLMLFIYLLVCMIAISNILKIFKGPLRSK